MTIAEPYCTIMNTALMEAVRHTVGLVSEQLCRKSRSRRESDPVSSYKQHRPQSVWIRTNTTHPDPTSPPTTRYFTAAKIINTHTLNIRLLRIPVCVYLTTESCTVCALQFVRYDTTVENIKDLLLLRTTTHTRCFLHLYLYIHGHGDCPKPCNGKYLCNVNSKLWLWCPLLEYQLQIFPLTHLFYVREQ